MLFINKRRRQVSRQWKSPSSKNEYWIS